jgi:long-chain fatty acid transport protein
LVPTEIRQEWNNTFTAGIGGDWRFAEDWIWRFSYQRYQTPVPDETYSPTIPDANQNVVTTSLGYGFGRSVVELAYGLVLYEDRTITTAQNPLYNGNYSLDVHLISASYRFTW